MDYRNQTPFKEFILVGFSENLQIRAFIFLAFCLVYLLTILGNILLISAVIISPKLHTPMYFFLCNLSFIDLCYSSCTVPKILHDVFSKLRTISIEGCMLQMNIGLFLGSTECVLLSVMAYDRYIAICFPLYYAIIINWNVCISIAVAVWLGTFVICFVPNILKPLIFCTQNILNHYACEILALIELACGNLEFYRKRFLVASVLLLVVPVVFIIVTYSLIISVIMKIQTSAGRSKAFSTCASHLTVVFMFYGTIMTTYTRQTSQLSSIMKYISLIYTVIIPLLNPLIYSLRNNDVKEALLQILQMFSPSAML